MIPLRLLLADDHHLMRQLILQVIADDWPDAVCEQVSDGAQLVRRAMEELWDIVISDISMPVMNGLEALETLKREVPDLPVLIISIHAEKRYALRALEFGAGGFVPKPRIEQELVKAIRAVLAGEIYLSAEFDGAL
ncbi:response regulator [Dinghuibacter silviterrae]|uniref:Response regulator receiver domain-containing protein n=1 Tax=Dinghuibacter silviterrae TaxID=1539049 RepID=A0A4R8DTI1_9BACT|nr:response regulator transcription factor [Dinghuibacter silviterrae]TDX01429.1 response regulator receiver domain-containing protein [Dinghuibacter silviterrae]